MSLYGNPFGGSDFVNAYYDTEPGAAYAAWMNPSGGQQPYAFTNFLQGRFPTIYNQYKAISPYEPELRFSEYLRRQNPQDVYNAAPARVRGENPSQYAPRVRWQGF